MRHFLFFAACLYGLAVLCRMLYDQGCQARGPTTNVLFAVNIEFYEVLNILDKKVVLFICSIFKLCFSNEIF